MGSTCNHYLFEYVVLYVCVHDVCCVDTHKIYKKAMKSIGQFFYLYINYLVYFGNVTNH